jgi:hypothetical protein
MPMLTFPKFKVDELELSVPGAVTVRVAAVLVTFPAELVTTSAKCAPLSAVVSAGVV